MDPTSLGPRTGGQTDGSSPNGIGWDGRTEDAKELNELLESFLGSIGGSQTGFFIKFFSFRTA